MYKANYALYSICDLTLSRYAISPKQNISFLCLAIQLTFPMPVLGAGLGTVEISLPIPSFYKGHKTPSKSKIHCSVPFSSLSSICEAHSPCHHPFLLWSDFQIDTMQRPKITLEACWCVCWSWTTGKGTGGFAEFFLFNALCFCKVSFCQFFLKSIREKKSIPVKPFFMHVGFCGNGLAPVRWVRGLPNTGDTYSCEGNVRIFKK